MAELTDFLRFVTNAGDIVQLIVYNSSGARGIINELEGGE